MCRIAGIYNPKSSSLQQDILLFRDAMHRGGPDDSGVFIHPTLPLAFGHRRLSLLDLSSAGHQPMMIDDGKLQIVFNGEIYNFKDIRSELKALGYTFKTQTDTEVILYSYKEWKKECFKRFNGMFALAMWDEREQELILARDHAGIKPLYYYSHGDVFLFASEVRAFKGLYPHWESSELWKPLFLLFGHLPEPFTTLKGVETLNKGEWLSVHLPSLEKRSGSFYFDEFKTTIYTEEEAIEAARDILPRAVERHLISDAPIGLFLSGGIDSSLLTLLAAPILGNSLKTLSIEFAEADFSEEAYQKIIIDITQADHKSFKIRQEDFEEAISDILLAMDQPSVDAVNVYFISKYARICGLKAVLSGLGADELFGGYPSFFRFRQWKYLNLIPHFISKQCERSGNSKLSRLSFDRFHPMISLFLINRGLYTVSAAAKLTGTKVNDIEDALDKVRIPPGIDYNNANANAAMEMSMYMKNQLLKDTDYMAMWHGLEVRVPFLDKELMQLANSISPKVKFQNNAIPKALLIEAFSTLLPSEIWNRKKQGFTFPFAHWLKNSDIFKPADQNEKAIFNNFVKGQLHWSRYWALKVSGLEKFNKLVLS